jgi:hypothetical protein
MFRLQCFVAERLQNKSHQLSSLAREAQVRVNSFDKMIKENTPMPSR